MKKDLTITEIYDVVKNLEVSSIEELIESYPELYTELVFATLGYIRKAFYTNDKMKNIISSYHENVGSSDDEALICECHTYIVTRRQLCFKGLVDSTDCNGWKGYLITSCKHYIIDQLRKVKPTTSLDQPINTDSDSDMDATDVASSMYMGADGNAHMCRSNSRTRRGLPTGLTPESMAVSKCSCADITSALIKDYFISHPEYFLVLGWRLQNSDGYFKAATLYEHMEEIVNKYSNTEQAALYTMKEALLQLCPYGVVPEEIDLSQAKLNRITDLLSVMESLNESYANIDIDVLSKKDLDVLINAKNKCTAKLAHWNERAQNSFKTNRTVLRYAS